MLPLSDQTNGENISHLWFYRLSYALSKWKSHIVHVVWLLKATNWYCNEQIILLLQIFSKVLGFTSAIPQLLGTQPWSQWDNKKPMATFPPLKSKTTEEFVLLFVFSLLSLHALRKDVAPLSVSVLGLLSTLKPLSSTPSDFVQIRKAFLFHTCVLFGCIFKLCFLILFFKRNVVSEPISKLAQTSLFFSRIWNSNISAVMLSFYPTCFTAFWVCSFVVVLKSFQFIFFHLLYRLLKYSRKGVL